MFKGIMIKRHDGVRKKETSRNFILTKDDHRQAILKLLY